MADRVLDRAHLGGADRRVAREEALADAVVARVGELDAAPPEHALEVSVRDVKQDAGAVARARVAARGAAVGEAAQDLDALLDYVVCGRTSDVCDEAKSAGIALERGVVHPTRGRQRHRGWDYRTGDATRYLKARALPRMSYRPRGAKGERGGVDAPSGRL